MSYQEEVLEKTPDLEERLGLSAGLGTPQHCSG